MPGPESHSYYSQRLRLHYVDWGNRDAPPLLLIHGGRDHCRNWDWVANELREQYHIIAPDLRGHGDSQWLIGGTYTLLDYVYDIAQLIEQMHLSPVTIIGHSLGGAVSLNYAGLCPGNVAKLVVIEGMGGRPTKDGKPRVVKPIEERVHGWVNILRRFSGREVRKYVSIEEAFNRMQEANPHLTPEQARHLTVHGANQNEDGTYSWKFDNYIRADLPLRETAVREPGVDWPVVRQDRPRSVAGRHGDPSGSTGALCGYSFARGGRGPRSLAGPATGDSASLRHAF